MTAKDVLQGCYYCAGCCNIDVGNLNVPRELVNHYKVNLLVPDDYVCTYTSSQPLCVVLCFMHVGQFSTSWLMAEETRPPD